MRPSRTLAIVAAHAEDRFKHLRDLSDLLPPSPDKNHDRIVSFVVIEALNTWGAFSRSFYLSCVYRAIRVTGSRVALGRSTHIVNYVQGIDFAVRNIRGAQYTKTRRPPWGWRDEPMWYKPTVVNRLASLLALSNLPQVQAAFGVPTPVFAELPVFRNFFAHRNRDTADRVRSLITTNYKGHGFSRRTHATKFLCSILSGRPQSILSDYVDDLRNIVGLMAQ